ncbi:hypothetical protein BKA81DRAFT_25455 [Phyllosticta paracitricarpa]
MADIRTTTKNLGRLVLGSKNHLDTTPTSLGSILHSERQRTHHASSSTIRKAYTAQPLARSLACRLNTCLLISPPQYLCPVGRLGARPRFHSCPATRRADVHVLLALEETPMLTPQQHPNLSSPSTLQPPLSLHRYPCCSAFSHLTQRTHRIAPPRAGSLFVQRVST